MTDPTSHPCPACGASATGSFCSSCGASLGQRTCTGCRADLSSQARFCHRCGQPAGQSAVRSGSSGSDRKAWTLAGVLCVLLVAGIAYQVSSTATGPVTADMANAGTSTGAQGVAGSGGPAPDISAMTPRERFDRLFNRIMQAAERSDSGEVQRFTPMALGAYSQLDVADADARYHAAVLRMQVGDFAGALALADTILTEAPGHLFGYIVRGETAGWTNDSAGHARARRDFLTQYDSEIKVGRVEYLEHKPAVDDFKANRRSTPGGVVIEPGANFPNVGRGDIDFAVGVIRAAGKSCDTVSGVSSHLTRPGFTVFCNNDKYQYEVRDVGGTWQVKVE